MQANHIDSSTGFPDPGFVLNRWKNWPPRRREGPVFAAFKTMAQPGRESCMAMMAEGVPEQTRVDALREAGTDAIQGYIHGHPMPEKALSDWFQHRRAP